MYLHSSAPAWPPHTVSQTEVLSLLSSSSAWEELHPRSRGLVEKVLTGDSGIAQRHVCSKDVVAMVSAAPHDLAAYFEKAAAFEADPKLAAAMRAFAANPDDEAAAAALRGSPTYVGKIGTTCVATMISGGHAQNALPQRATANINCRIFPGHSKEAIAAELNGVIGNQAVKLSDVTGEDSISAPASPMRPDFVNAAEKAMHLINPGLAIFPSQASGASDSMWYRALGVPSYGASPVFSKDSEDFSHGLNERVPLSNVAPGVTYYLSLFTDLSK